METLKIDIVNPKAKRIIRDLADLNLINIQDKDPMKSLESLLSRLRNKSKEISLDEITREVELVRSKRYGKRN